MMHLTLSCDVHHSQIIQRIFDKLRMTINVRYMVTLPLVYVSFVVSAA
jgi:hypothetical protein